MKNKTTLIPFRYDNTQNEEILFGKENHVWDAFCTFKKYTFLKNMHQSVKRCFPSPKSLVFSEMNIKSYCNFLIRKWIIWILPKII